MAAGLDRRRFLGLAAGLAGGVAGTAGCARMVGDPATIDGKHVLRFAQYITPASGPAAETNKKWLHKVVRTFERENPEWTVSLEGYDWDKVDQRLVLDVRAGVGHDLALTSPQFIAKHAAAESLRDLTPFTDAWPAHERNDFSWSPVWRSGIANGKILGIPLGVSTRLLAYRKSAVDASDVSTLDELLTAARKATTHQTWGLGMYLGSDRATTELSLAALTWNFGGDFYDQKQQRAALTGDACIEAARWIYDAVHSAKVVPPFAYAPTAVLDDVLLTDFLSGKTAMSFGFGNYWISALDDAKMVSGCFPPEAGCRPSTSDIGVLPTRGHAAFTNAWLISLGAECRNPDMAWKLLQVALRPELLREYGDAGMPARLSEYSRPAYRSPFYRTWLAAARKGRPMPPTPYYQELSDACASALQEALGGHRSNVAHVLRRYENDWNGKYAGK